MMLMVKVLREKTEYKGIHNEAVRINECIFIQQVCQLFPLQHFPHTVFMVDYTIL